MTFHSTPSQHNNSNSNSKTRDSVACCTVMDLFLRFTMLQVENDLTKIKIYKSHNIFTLILINSYQSTQQIRTETSMFEDTTTV